MYYEYPDMDKAYHLGHQYYYGNNMIVSPITRSMHGRDSISQTIWLPDGIWYDYRNNNMLKGDKDISQNYSLDEVPVFIKAGSIIPTQTPKLRITGSILDTLILTVYPGQDGNFNLYEDEGNTEEYRNGIYAFTNMAWQDGSKTLKIVPDDKIFPGQVTERSYQIRIVAAKKPSQVKDWTYDNQKNTINISTPKNKVLPVIVDIL
jgi:alpha-glucosidase (family GH31 glycosyl hydrolase)